MCVTFTFVHVRDGLKDRRPTSFLANTNQTANATMVLAHWIQRFGQVLAPDPNVPGYDAPREEGDAGDGVSQADGASPVVENGDPTDTTEAETSNGSNGNDEQPQADEESSLLGGLWSVVAPDPNFSAPPSPTPTADPSTGTSAGVSTTEAAAHDVPPSPSADAVADAGAEIECVHCHKMTSPIAVRTARPLPAAGLMATPSSAASAAFLSPPPSASNASTSVTATGTATTTADAATQLSANVLSAAQSTALAITSPTTIWESRKNFFILCASATALNAKKVGRMRKKLGRDPSLMRARATDMDNLVYDGATPLHACAMAGNRIGALLLLGLDVDKTYQDEEKDGDDANDNNAAATSAEKMTIPSDRIILLSLLDLQGRTPLHVAAQRGQLELVRLLKAAMTASDPGGTAPVGPDAPTDLSGRTPLGWAVTSRDTKARRNGRELERELFSPGDGSVCGVPTPAVDRSGCFGFQWRRTVADADPSQQQQPPQPSTPFTGMKSPVPLPSVPLLPCSP